MSEKKINDSGGFRILRAVEAYFAEQRDCEKQSKNREISIGNIGSIEKNRNTVKPHQKKNRKTSGKKLRHRNSEKKPRKNDWFQKIRRTIDAHNAHHHKKNPDKAKKKFAIDNRQKID